MKKTILILMIAVSIMTSCTNSSTKGSVSNTDSTQVDTSAVDTVAITDSMVVISTDTVN